MKFICIIKFYHFASGLSIHWIAVLLEWLRCRLKLKQIGLFGSFFFGKFIQKVSSDLEVLSN